MAAAAWICLLLPLASAVAITLAGTAIPRRVAGYVSTRDDDGRVRRGGRRVRRHARQERRRTAAHVDDVVDVARRPGPYHFGLTLLTDQLSIVMMLIVTGVGSLIVAYSVGYMDGEDEERRFFAYMSLFVFSMLLLVQGGNLLLLLAGWGMVGLSSYLLIGYYQERASAIAAAKKAFVMNAFGDATMALALFLLIQHTGKLDYAGVFAASPHGGAVANLIALGLLGGAVAKSAQIPLHTWLPDAMEGPTPVSALIHAATMVTAGVYLIVRCHPLFENAYVIEDLAAGLGAATLLMAGLIALVQTDIKRVIAYSTMSQIGYMFVGAGLGAYPNAMFHLMTHAFFKALLFLAAGIAIHAVVGEQDIRKLAGVGKLMPFTKCVFLSARSRSSASSRSPASSRRTRSSPPRSTAAGTATSSSRPCLVGAFLTGLYAFRLFFIVFTGEPSAFAREHFHAPSRPGRAALDALDGRRARACSRSIGGFLQFAPLWHPLTTWLEPGRARRSPSRRTRRSGSRPALAIAVGLAGIGVAWAIYAREARAGAARAAAASRRSSTGTSSTTLLWYRTRRPRRARPRTRSSSAADRAARSRAVTGGVRARLA